MKKNDPEEENFGKYENLAALLRTTDLSGKSKVRDSLKARLLSKAPEEEKQPFFSINWLFPAAAAACAALLLMVNLGQKEQKADRLAYYQAPDAGYSSYASCGRQGLKDYLSAPRF